MFLPARRDGKWGFVNLCGNCAIEFKYDSVARFVGPYAVVGENIKYGAIDYLGRIICEPTFDDIILSPDGLFCLQKNELWNCINIHSRSETGYIFTDASGFSDGVCAVATAHDAHELYGYIDRNFSYVVQPAYESALKSQSGRLIVYDQGENCYFVLSTDGNNLLRLNYESVGHYSEGFASVTFDYTKHGFVDLSGKLAIEMKFENSLNFTEGLCACYLDGQCGFVDFNGTFVVSPQYLGASRFLGGRATVRRAGVDHMSWIVIDSAGNEIYENICLGMHYVSPGILKVTNDGYSSYLDNNFSLIWVDQ